MAVDRGDTSGVQASPSAESVASTAEVSSVSGGVASQQLLQRMLEDATDVMAALGADDRYEWVSPSVTAVLGWAPEQIVGESAADFVHADDLSAVADARAHPNSDGVSRVGQFRFRCADGTYRWMSGVWRAVDDDSGQLARRVVGLHDVQALVDERRRAEVARQRFAALVEALPDPTFVLAPVREGSTVVDFRYTHLNAAAARMCGRDAQEVVGRTLVGLIPGAGGDGALDVYVDSLVSGQPRTLQVPWVAGGGGAVWLELSTAVVGDELIVMARGAGARPRRDGLRAAGEERYRLLAENASDVVVQSSPGGTVEWISPSVVSLLGWRPEEVVGRAFVDLLHPEDIPVVAAAQVRLDQGEALIVEVRLRTASGDYRWVASHVRVVFDAAGEVVGRVAGWRDVHDQHLAVGALEQSEELFRTAMGSSAVGMCLVGPDGAFVGVNEALCRILGRSPDSLMAATWRELTHPEDVGGDLGLVEAVLAGRRDGYRLRKRYLRPDGAIVWGDLSVSCVRRPDGAVRHFICQVVDVTEMHEAVVEAEQAERRFRLMASHASDVVFTAGPDRSIAWVSPNVAQTLGWAPSDMVGEAAAAFLHPEDARGAAADLRALFAEEGAVDALDLTLRWRTKSATYVWMLGLATRVLADDGRLDYVVVGLRDVTERHRAAEQLADSEEKFRLLAENASDVVILSDGGAIAWVSPSVSRTFGGAQQDWVGRRLIDLLHPDDRHLFAPAVAAVEAGQRIKARARVRAEDGAYHWVEAVSQPFHDASGERTGSITAARVIDDTVQAEKVRDDLERQLRLLAENASDLVIRTDAERRLTWVSPNARDALGRSAEEMLGMRLTELMRPEVAADLQPDQAPFYEGGTDPVPTEDYLIELRTAAGVYRWFSGKGQALVDADGTPQGVVVGLRDVTELVAARTEAQDREARRQAILDSLLDPHVLLQAVRDPQGDIVDFIYADANDAACDYMHMPHGELIGARLLDLLPGQAGSGMLALYAHALDEGVPLVLDDYAYPHEILGSERRYDIRGLGVGDALSFTWRDVTERHQAVREMNRRARHDGLTGLLNREAVFDTLNAMLGQRPRTGHDVAVAFCDLDGFKDINDTHGHQMGDFVLRTVGTHIRGLLRADDLVARLGGDEFLLILPGVHGLESAVDVAEKVRQHCAEPHEHDGLTYRPLVSIGVTILRRGEDADELIARADRAMYRAKAAGGNRVVAAE